MLPGALVRGATWAAGVARCAVGAAWREAAGAGAGGGSCRGPPVASAPIAGARKWAAGPRTCDAKYPGTRGGSPPAWGVATPGFIAVGSKAGAAGESWNVVVVELTASELAIQLAM